MIPVLKRITFGNAEAMNEHDYIISFFVIAQKRFKLYKGIYNNCFFFFNFLYASTVVFQKYSDHN